MPGVLIAQAVDPYTFAFAFAFAFAFVCVCVCVYLCVETFACPVVL